MSDTVMMTMVERVACAIYNAERSPKAQARAVIAAMRDPTPEMLAAGHVAWFATYGGAEGNPDDEALTGAWRAMIDAAGNVR